MSELNFPINPIIGQDYTFQSNTWKWNGTGWVLVDTFIETDPIYLADKPHIALKTDIPSASDFLPLSGGTLSGDIYATNLTGTNNGDERYTNNTPVPTTIGGVSAGMTFNNLTIQQIFDYILYPELYPTLTAPSATFTATTLNTYYEVGYQIATISFLASFNRGVINPAYGTSGYRSGLPTEYIYSGTGLTTVVTNTLSNIQSISNYVIQAGTQSWSNSIIYAQGEQPLSSKGNNYESALPSGTTATITRTTTGIYPFLYGMSENALDGGTLYGTFSSTKILEAQSNKTVTLNGSLQYIYFAYPATYANLVSIIDQNGFNVTSSFTQSTISVTSSGLGANFTTNYKVYRTVDPTSVISGAYQFKFS